MTPGVTRNQNLYQMIAPAPYTQIEALIPGLEAFMLCNSWEFVYGEGSCGRESG
jgi:hypothetical protein